MSRVLLLEDEETLRSQLVGFLSNQGLTVKEFATVAAARNADPRNFDIAVLDWNLSDGEGIDLVKLWRSQGHRIPIIMLTARTDVIDRVLGLELGANDYVLKPYEPRELLARIRGHLRTAAAGSSASPSAREQLQLGEIRLDLESREAFRSDIPVELTKMEFDLLVILVRAAGKVFTRDELLARVWGMDTSIETRTVDAHVVKLRQKFGETAIETVRGLGYRVTKPKAGGN